MTDEILCFYIGNWKLKIVGLFFLHCFHCSRICLFFNVQAPRKVFEFAVRKFWHIKKRVLFLRFLFCHGFFFFLLPNVKLASEEIPYRVLKKKNKGLVVYFIKRGTWNLMGLAMLIYYSDASVGVPTEASGIHSNYTNTASKFRVNELI